MDTQEENKIEWTKINHDVNGNPRYVCHFFHLLTDAEINDRSGMDFISRRYKIAVKRANTLGGRKFHNKQYGGGIVFCTYSLGELEKRIKELTGKEKESSLDNFIESVDLSQD